MAADNPDQKINLKAFCSEIMNDHDALAKEHAGYKDLPQFSKIDSGIVFQNYLQIKKDVSCIVQTELERMLDTPELGDLIIKKESF